MKTSAQFGNVYTKRSPAQWIYQSVNVLLDSLLTSQFALNQCKPVELELCRRCKIEHELTKLHVLRPAKTHISACASTQSDQNLRRTHCGYPMRFSMMIH